MKDFEDQGTSGEKDVPGRTIEHRPQARESEAKATWCTPGDELQSQGALKRELFDLSVPMELVRSIGGHQ